MYYRSTLADLFEPNESPYIAMYHAGRIGYTIEEVSNYCNLIGIPLRVKDIENWQAGYFERTLKRNPFNPRLTFQYRTSKPKAVQILTSNLEDFECLSDDWCGTPKRFFPCSADNRPLMKWGWKEGVNPGLLDKASAKALSPCGWIGQNLLAQPFIVIDIDGVGHGTQDMQVINWGNQWKNETLCYENPAKPGSFHLYFTTNRIIPTAHFPYAKLDFLGNAMNTAVYFKNKQSNRLPTAELDSCIWNSLKAYLQSRKDKNHA